tara:strand:- start:47753 stop:48652 length:900 start_codon:yes stop_codon:yes gene_type:complete
MPLKKVLITGPNGFIGSKIAENLSKNPSLNVFGCGKGVNRLPNVSIIYHEIDLTSLAEMRLLFSQINPDVIIHCAAISQVDICENNPDLCFEVNTTVTSNIVDIIIHSNTHLIYFSSDFVFDGINDWYDENECSEPISRYGESKRRGEMAVEKLTNWSIIRPVLVYGYSKSASRGNFFTWVRDGLSNGEKLNIVTDQFRTPTFIGDVVKLVERIINNPLNGNFNIGGAEKISIYDFAVQIAEVCGLNSAYLSTSESKDVANANLRPSNSCFTNSRIIECYDFNPKGIADGLKEAVKQVN